MKMEAARTRKQNRARKPGELGQPESEVGPKEERAREKVEPKKTVLQKRCSRKGAQGTFSEDKCGKSSKYRSIAL
jgi:hypothetical protein